MNSLVWIAMKDVASCDKLGRGACDLRTRDFLMRSYVFMPRGKQTPGIETS